jgi:spoIIIJ-associated protein
VTEVEKTGKTIDEAVDKALSELGVSREEVEVDILEQPSKGLFGFLGSKPGRVKVKVKENPSRKARELLEQILDVMELKVDMDIEENKHGIFISMQGTDLGILIGRRGETLDALQYLVNLSANKNQEQKQRIILDVEGYRRRREETLKNLALKLAEKAKQKGRNVVLEPMNSQERRIIHTTLQSRNDIYTFSEGEDPYRKIVISPRK